jgi:hypothetical protein
MGIENKGVRFIYLLTPACVYGQTASAIAKHALPLFVHFLIVNKSGAIFRSNFFYNQIFLHICIKYVKMIL